MTILPNILGNYTIYPTDRGYDEILFDEEQDISEGSIDLLNQKILSEFGPFDLTVGQLDWRDPVTLWIHDTPEELELPNFDHLPAVAIHEYLVEFADNGNTDGFTPAQLVTIKAFLDDIVLYCSEAAKAKEQTNNL